MVPECREGSECHGQSQTLLRWDGRGGEVSSQRLNEVFDIFAAKHGKEDIERYFPSREVAPEITLATSL